MHFIFLTRCFTPENIARIKGDIMRLFIGSEHTYEHLIVVDMSHGSSRDDYVDFADEVTKVFFTDQKPVNDTQNVFGMNEALSTVTQDGYVYVLDDDNTLHKYFLDVCKECNGEDAIVFKIIGRPDLGNPCTMHILRRIDWANFITKVSTIKNLGIDVGDNRNEDALFFTKMVRNNCKIKFINKMIAYYNALPRTASSREETPTEETPAQTEEQNTEELNTNEPTAER